MLETHNDRRVNRSTWASRALQLQLLHVAERYRLDAVVLSDSLGHLWAASCNQPDGNELVTDLARYGQVSGAADLRTRRGRKSVVVRRLKIGPATLFLAAQGAQRRSKPALDDATPGVERILSTLL
jgi:hypothetical protein